MLFAPMRDDIDMRKRGYAIAVFMLRYDADRHELAFLLHAADG